MIDFVFRLFDEPPGGNGSPAAGDCMPGIGDDDYALVDSNYCVAPYFYLNGEWKLGATSQDANGNYKVPKDDSVQDDEECNWEQVMHQAEVNEYCDIKVSGESKPYFQIFNFQTDEFQESFFQVS